jgi:hypothetical protein
MPNAGKLNAGGIDSRELSEQTSRSLEVVTLIAPV